MINRSLIRIKTVQILYSFLLTRKDFKLENVPAADDPSQEHRFAYSVYLDLLFLLLKLSSEPLGSGRTLPADNVLKKNRVARSLRDNDAFKGIIARNRERLDRFDSCLDDLLAAITASAIYNDYKRKRKHELADDVAFWNAVFNTIVRRHKGVERVLRRDENFSHVGFDRGLKMFSDTLLSFDDTRASYLKARADLDRSLSMAYDLYHALLMLPVYITRLHDLRITEAKNKYLPSYDDLNPNTRLVDNLYVKALEDNTTLNEYVAEHPDADPANWRDSDILFASLLDLITSSDIYREYIETAPGNFATDASFWRDVMRTIIVPSDELAESLENRAVYWNDDLAIMSTFVLKTMRRSYASADGEQADDETAATPGIITLLPKFMNEADEAFGTELFELVVEHRGEYRDLIDGFIDTTQWDTERIAFMDIVVLLTAIAEIVHYPSIPVQVSLNEYIEIANDYSTPRSGAFVNGILSSVVKRLYAEGKISKNLQ